MTDAPARPFPWEKRYPDGVSWDVTLDARPVPAILRDAAAAWPERDLFDWRGTRLTYGRIAAMAGRACSAFKAMGLQPGQTVALHLPNHIHHPVFFFGALAAGLRVAHLSPLGSKGDRVQRLSEPQSMEHPRAVGADLHPGTDLAEGPGLLDDAYRESGIEQAQRRSEATQASPDDQNGGLGSHRLIPDRQGARR